MYCHKIYIKNHNNSPLNEPIIEPEKSRCKHVKIFCKDMKIFCKEFCKDFLELFIPLCICIGVFILILGLV